MIALASAIEAHSRAHLRSHLLNDRTGLSLNKCRWLSILQLIRACLFNSTKVTYLTPIFIEDKLEHRVEKLP
jgi:hypothetical protein